LADLRLLQSFKQVIEPLFIGDHFVLTAKCLSKAIAAQLLAYNLLPLFLLLFIIHLRSVPNSVEPPEILLVPNYLQSLRFGKDLAIAANAPRLLMSPGTNVAAGA
jgi:hypothetical protein